MNISLQLIEQRSASMEAGRHQPLVDVEPKRVLIPPENKGDLANVPDEIMGRVQPVVYADPIMPRFAPLLSEATHDYITMHWG